MEALKEGSKKTRNILNYNIDQVFYIAWMIFHDC